jgi:hypothetical protein
MILHRIEQDVSDLCVFRAPLNQDVSNGTPSFGNKYFLRTEERISLISTSVLKLKNTSYEIYFYSFFMLMVFVTVFSSCTNDAVEVPKLRCTQPDFTTNKTVAEVHTNAGAIVTIHI